MVYFRSVIQDSGFGLGYWRLLISGVENQLVNVLQKSILVSIERLLTSVLTPVINRDADGASKLNSQTSSLDLIKGEASAKANSVIIPNSGAVDGWSEIIKGPGSISSSLCPSSLKSSFLSGSLVEPSPDIVLPMFSEMDVGDDVVVLDHKSQIIF